jgi:hypothetical protein
LHLQELPLYQLLQLVVAVEGQQEQVAVVAVELYMLAVNLVLVVV